MGLAAAAVVGAVLCVFLIEPGPVAGLEERVTDLITGWVGGGHSSGQVAIVEIDERSVAQFGRWPWPRDRLGLLVERTLGSGAATVVLDAMFPEPDRGTNDAVLARALAGHPTVIGYDFRFVGGEPGGTPCEMQALPLVIPATGQERFFRASSVVCSIAELSRAAAGAGFLNAAPDHDGRLRHVPLVISYKSRYYPSLALTAVIVYRHWPTMRLVESARGTVRFGLGDRLIPLEGPGWLRLRFRGAKRNFPYVSAADVMSDHASAPGLRRRIAVIGATASGIESTVATPTDPLFPGVEVQATAIDNLLQGDPWNRPADARVWELALLLAAGLASAFLLTIVRSLWGALITLMLVIGVFAGSVTVLSTAGVLLSPLPMMAAIGGNYAVLTLVNYLWEKHRADRIERQLVSAQALTENLRVVSEQRYQQLVENVNDAIIMHDLKGQLLFANRRFREWFGLNDSDMGRVMLEDYIAPEWRAAVREHHERRVCGETAPDQIEFEGRRPDGTRIWIEALVTPVREDGRITGTQSALRDITERKRIEAQYLQAQKMESIGRLAGGVAHDFNNLLTVIGGYSTMLLSNLCEGDAGRAYATEILDAVQRATELTRKLLAFSRKQVTHPQPANLNTIVTEAERMFRRVIGEDIELITRLSPEIGQVVCDPGQMHQVLMNLVVNSRDSMPLGGKLTIETRNVDVCEGGAVEHDGVPAGLYVDLGVTDTGVGMSEEVQQHLFEPFFTTKDPEKGTGLGLATVYGIVSQSGGRIRVRSAPGAGAAFHIYLPRAGGGAIAERAASQAGASPYGSETVLLVEDQDAVRQLAGMVLEQYGYHVLRAASGPDAIKLAAEYPGAIDLLLTDVVLPRMNGQALAGALKTVRPGLKVLYTSGYSEEIIADHGVLSAAGYVPKPFTPEVLAAKVREALAAK